MVTFWTKQAFIGSELAPIRSYLRDNGHGECDRVIWWLFLIFDACQNLSRHWSIVRKIQKLIWSDEFRYVKTRDPKIILPELVKILNQRVNKHLKIDNKQYISLKSVDEALKAKDGTNIR